MSYIKKTRHRLWHGGDISTLLTINSLLGRSFSDTSVNELKVNDANLTSPGEIGQMLFRWPQSDKT
jgi:hypothetical protein